MTTAEFAQSWLGKALIALALFAAGYYFPLFNAPRSDSAPAASSAASSASAATPSR